MSEVVLVEGKKGEQSFTVERNENKTFVLILGGERDAARNVLIELAGEGGEAQILGIIVGRKQTTFSLNTVQRHLAPNTTSDLLVRGVFDGASRLRYRGLIEIAKEAQNSNAFQKEDNLVLSPQVDIDTRPDLEIDANQVRCTHAATIGKINPEELYYLTTRGLDKLQAEKLLVEGFLREVTERIDKTKERKALEERVERLLGQ